MTKNANEITRWDKIKHAVARWLLASEVAKVNTERNTFVRMKEELERRFSEFEKEKANYTVTDMVRELLAGFDPKLLDDEDTDLPEILGEVEAQDAFLAKMKGLSEHKELKQLIDYLTRSQVFYTAKYAEDINKQNFGRATINGFALIMEEIVRLTSVYNDRHKGDPEFDEHEVL